MFSINFFTNFALKYTLSLGLLNRNEIGVTPIKKDT